MGLALGGGRHPSPNYGVQLTASSLRCATASGSSSPRALVFCKKCKYFLLRHTSGDRFYLDNVTLGRVRWFHLGLQTATGRTSAIDQMRDHKVHRLCGRELRQGQHRL
jgi:hypothetical protein